MKVINGSILLFRVWKVIIKGGKKQVIYVKKMLSYDDNTEI